MNRKATLLLITGLVAIVGLVASQANAYTDYRDVQWVFKGLSPGESYTGTFDIEEPGDSCILLWGCDRGGYEEGTPLRDTRVSFLILTLGGVEAEIVLGGSDPDSWLQREEIDEFVFFLHVESIDADMLVEGDLMEDGQLQYTITNMSDSWLSPLSAGGDSHNLYCNPNKNDFLIIKAAKLETKLESAIPEPSAALVFAVGFAVIGTRVRQRPRA